MRNKTKFISFVAALALASLCPAPIIDNRPPPMIPERTQEQRAMDQQANTTIGQVGSLDTGARPDAAVSQTGDPGARAVLRRAAEFRSNPEAVDVLRSVENRMERERSTPMRNAGIAALVLGFVALVLVGLRRWVDVAAPGPAPETRKLRW